MARVVQEPLNGGTELIRNSFHTTTEDSRTFSLAAGKFESKWNLCSRSDADGDGLMKFSRPSFSVDSLENDR